MSTASRGGVRRWDTGAAIGNILVGSAVRRVLQTKTGPKGTAWEPLSAKYQAWLAKHPAKEVSGGSILRRTGNLSKMGYSLLQWGAGIITVYSQADYSAYHQEGTRKMPARPFLGLSTEDAQDIKIELINKIVKEAKR